MDELARKSLASMSQSVRSQSERIVSVRHDLISPKMQKLKYLQNYDGPMKQDISGCKVVYCFDDDMAVIGSESGHVLFVNLTTSKIDKVFKEHTGSVSTIELAYIQIEDSETQKLIPKRILLTGSTKSDNLILAWDLDKMKPYKRLSGHTDTISSMRDLQDERTIVTASFDCKIAFWDLHKNPRCIQLLEEPQSPVLCMEYDHATKKLIVGCLDSQIFLWNLKFNPENEGAYQGCSILRKFSVTDIPLDLGMSISFDNILISIENDGNVRLYDLCDPKEGECLKKIQMENSFVQKSEKIKDFVIVERGQDSSPIMFLMDDQSKVCRIDDWNLQTLRQSTIRETPEIFEQMRDSVLSEFQFRPKQ